MTSDDLDWQTDAVCRQHDPDLWFAEERSDRERAKAICSTCPVSTECLEMAVRLRVYSGIFGGYTMKEGRPHIEKRRGRPPKPEQEKKPASWPRPGTAGEDVLRVLVERPGLTQVEVADLAGCSVRRVGEVRRRAQVAGLLTDAG